MPERPQEEQKLINLLDGAKKWSPSQPAYSLSGSRELVSQFKKLERPQGKDAGTGFFIKDGLPYGGVKGLNPVAGRVEPNPELAEQFFRRPAQTKTPRPEIRLPKGYDPSKKKNAGGLSAARQHVVPDFFPGQLDQMKLGPMRVQPIAFKGASPQINLRTVAFQGFLRNQA